MEFLEKRNEICHIWAISQFGTGTQIGVVSVPIDRTKVVPVPRQSGTGTHLQNRVGINTDQSGTGTNQSGTGTNQSGTGTDASGSPDCCTLALLSPKFVHE